MAWPNSECSIRQAKDALRRDGWCSHNEARTESRVRTMATPLSAFPTVR